MLFFTAHDIFRVITFVLFLKMVKKFMKYETIMNKMTKSKCDLKPHLKYFSFSYVFVV